MELAFPKWIFNNYIFTPYCLTWIFPLADTPLRTIKWILVNVVQKCIVFIYGLFCEDGTVAKKILWHKSFLEKHIHSYIRSIIKWLIMTAISSLLDSLWKDKQVWVHLATLKAKAFLKFDCRPFGCDFAKCLIIILGCHYKLRFRQVRIRLLHIGCFRYPLYFNEMMMKIIQFINQDASKTMASLRSK